VVGELVDIGRGVPVADDLRRHAVRPLQRRFVLDDVLGVVQRHV
jgi:hypothetical protein